MSLTPSNLRGRWFTGTSCTGVVRVEHPDGTIDYYIGTGRGDDEQEDLQFIAEWGVHFPIAAGRVLFGDKLDD